MPRLVATTCLAAILLLHGAAIATQALRAPHHDEGEHLHAAWRVAQGDRLYRDFNENHSPYLYLLLQGMVPSGGTPDFPLLDTESYLLRARIAAAAAGLIAVLALAALAWRATGEPSAALIAAAVLLTPGALWLRMFADVRSEPFTLALFWAGALLVLWDRESPLRGGIGIALVGIAAVWNPKWPLESLILGIYWLTYAWRSWRAYLVALIPPLLMLPLGAMLAPWRDIRFYSMTFTRAFYGWFATSEVVDNTFGFPHPFAYSAPRFSLWLALVAVATLSFSVWRRRLGGVALVAILLVLASLAQLRLLYPWPRLWPQFFVMWAFTVTLAYALLIGAVPLRVRKPIAIAAILLCTAIFAIKIRPLFAESPRDRAYWGMAAFFQQRLRPGATVWIDPSWHPIAVRDAHYYWYAFADQVPFALSYDAPPGFLPKTTERDLPPCTFPPSMQFIDGNALPNLPVARACFEQALREGRLARTPLPWIFEVRPR